MIAKLTNEQEAAIPNYVAKWTRAGLSTSPIPRERAIAIIQRFEREIMKRDPRPVVVLESPLGAWIAVNMFIGLDSAVPKSQVRSQVESQVRSQVWSQVRSQVESQVWSGANIINFIWPYVSGHWWASYFAWCDFMQFIGVSGLPSTLGAFIDLTEVGLVYPLEHVTVVSSKPSEIHLNNSGALHRDGGMALSYADGWGIWSLNGVIVPKYVAEIRGEMLDPQLALKESNVEVRREIIRKVGIERFIQACGAKVLDTWNNYELLSVRLSDEQPDCRYLKMLNPSIGVWHVEGVSPECRTVADALNFRKPEALRRIPVADSGEDWAQQGDVCMWPRKAKSLKPFPSQLT